MHLVMSRNGYSYVHGNPVNLTDPSGMFVPILFGASVIAGVAIGAWDMFVTQGYGRGGHNAGCLVNTDLVCPQIAGIRCQLNTG